MSLKFELKVDERLRQQFFSSFESWLNKLKSDKNWIWRPGKRVIREALTEEFDKQGRAGSWKALSERYITWKNKQKALGVSVAGGDIIGVFTGAMRRAATVEGAAGNVVRVKSGPGFSGSLTWGVNIPYADAFNREREFMRFLPEDETKLEGLLNRFLAASLTQVMGRMVDVIET